MRMSTLALQHPVAFECDETSVYALIAQLLGLRGVHSKFDLIKRVEKGLGFASVRSLQRRANLSDQEINLLIASRRTLNRREDSGNPLSPKEAEHVVRVARVIACAQLIFAARPKYVAVWLHDSMPSTGGRTPLQLLATDSGALMIEQHLIGIDHGMFA